MDLDLSFSGVVDSIQDNETKALKLIREIAIKKEENINVIKRLESQLSQAKSISNRLDGGIENVVKYMKYEYPFTIGFSDLIINVNQSNVAINRVVKFVK